jgi:hypothetical protein
LFRQEAAGLNEASLVFKTQVVAACSTGDRRESPRKEIELDLRDIIRCILNNGSLDNYLMSRSQQVSNGIKFFDDNNATTRIIYEVVDLTDNADCSRYPNLLFVCQTVSHTIVECVGTSKGEIVEPVTRTTSEAFYILPDLSSSSSESIKDWVEELLFNCPQFSAATIELEESASPSKCPDSKLSPPSARKLNREHDDAKRSGILHLFLFA